MKSSKTLLIITCGLCFILLCGCEQGQGITEVLHVRAPLTLSMRGSAIRGVVLQITNRANEHLECRIYAISADGEKESKTFRCVINSGKMQEVGHLELDGWYLERGEKVVISAVGYSSKIIVRIDESYNYSWSYSL